MAFQSNPALKNRPESGLSQPLYFRRREEVPRKKRIQRKVKLKLRHIVLCFFFLAVLFYTFQHLYLFLISWDKFNITETEVLCRKTSVRKEVQEFLGTKKLGNIFLFDIGHLKQTLEAHRWIEEVQVRKIFPFSLRIEIKETTPLAILEKDNFFLIDREGAILEQIESREMQDLPLLIDSNHFEKHYPQNLKLAWDCLDSLTPSEREQVDVIDLSDYNNVTIKLKSSSIWLILGRGQYPEKIRSFKAWSSHLMEYGELEYVDLRFEDRFYIKSQKKSSLENLYSSNKEEN